MQEAPSFTELMLIRNGCSVMPCDLLNISRQSVTKDTFRQYRILGKGGFGEVGNGDSLNFFPIRDQE